MDQSSNVDVNRAITHAYILISSRFMTIPPLTYFGGGHVGFEELSRGKQLHNVLPERRDIKYLKTTEKPFLTTVHFIYQVILV